MNPTDEQVEIAAQAIADRYEHKALHYRVDAKRALTAAMPLIEQAVAEEIASRIRHQIDPRFANIGDPQAAYNEGLKDAVRYVVEYAKEQSDE